jgi:hypothetical protein
VSFSSAQRHVELSAVEENGGAVVDEVPDPTIGFDELDGAIEAFGAGIGDAMRS